MKSIIEILKSPNAVLGVLALALLAQMPHAAAVFRMTVHSANSQQASLWEIGHSYSYAVALELAVLLFVIQNRHVESYGFAVVSVFVNLSYYGLHGVNLFAWSAFPAYLVSVALPVAIALYSHVAADAKTTEQEPAAKRVTRTVRNTQTVEQSEQFVVPTVQQSYTVIEQPVSEPVQSSDYKSLTDEQKREQLAIVLNNKTSLSKSKLADMFGVSRTTVYAWIRANQTSKIEQGKLSS